MKSNQETKPEIPSDMLSAQAELVKRAFPGGFTVPDEANALTAFAFRNGSLENLHAGKASALTSDPSLSRITDTEMKQLMIEASEKLAKMLNLREEDPEKYQCFIQSYALSYCRLWNRT
jgi:hypothetical protein